MRKMILSKFNLFAMILVLLGFTVACSVANDEVDYTEHEKDISGTWQVVQGFRNGEDITKVMDFSEFRLNFNGDAYSFENYLPFLVNEEGTYSLNDPQYPTHVNLIPQNGAGEVKAPLQMPVTAGKRQISLTFSPGCSNNSYTYRFEKIEEN